MAVVGIFGCGPAGLFAARAAETLGHEVVIISRKQKSVIYGAQYLHRPIPDLTDPSPDGKIKTYRLGTAAGYAHRVYGNGNRRTSWEKVPDEEVGIWNLRQAYNNAWERYSERIVHELLSYESVAQYTAVCDYLISTVPRWAICEHPDFHFFHSIPIMVTKHMEYTGLRQVFGGQVNAVVYNGTKYGEWYRTSVIFGHESTEAVSSPDFLRDNPHAEPGFKVFDTNCDCHPNLIRAGRLGKWERGILTHHAFEDTIKELSH